MWLKKIEFFLAKVENIVGKGENAGYQHVLIFPQYSQTAFFSEALTSGLCDKALHKTEYGVCQYYHFKQVSNFVVW